MRIVLVALVVLGAEWRFADPVVVAKDPNRSATPWAMLALLFPVALGVWTFEVTAEGQPGLKADFLWGVLLGTLCYVGVSIALLFSS